MKFNFGFDKCSSFLNTWDTQGYRTEVIRNDFNLDDNTLRAIKKRSIPAGSSWHQYIGYFFIRLFNISAGEEVYYVLSIAKVRIEEKDNKFFPETYINVFDHNGITLLKNQGIAELVNLIHRELSEDFPSVEKTVTLPNYSQDKFYTLKPSSNSKDNAEYWRYIEFFLLKNALESKDFISIATLCTMEDKFDLFDKVGLLDAHSLSIKGIISSYVELKLLDHQPRQLESRIVSNVEIQKAGFFNFFNAKIDISRSFILILLCLSFVCGIFVSRLLFSTRSSLLLKCNGDKVINLEISAQEFRVTDDSDKTFVFPKINSTQDTGLSDSTEEFYTKNGKFFLDINEKPAFSECVPE
ncbi:hypothetical protein [Dolichospermum circinale]|uniref:hypothetical protein n=1 Tax=Dolichospermum circinale TaxID=109265 RepID=UPI00232B7E07|nr:hypothetical protein [Dolichospermum circinale]MDB9450483.1 hypothetical protein [Dolichospermum circinale CS-547]